MYEFWYDYLKVKYGEEVKLCYIITYSKNRWYLSRHCRRCWSKIWHFKVKKILIELDNIVADMLSNKKLSRGRKLYISFVSITQSYFVVPENIMLNSANYFIMKIPNKSLNKSYLIINRILTFKTVLCEFL